MLDTLAIIGPLFIAIATGFAAVALGAFSKADIRVLGRFVIHFALPALLFKALSDRAFDEIIHLDYLGAYALGSLAVLALCASGAYFLQGVSRTSAGMIAMGAALSNSGFIGFPVVTQFLGDGAAIALALSMLVENLLVLPIALVIAEPAGGDGRGRARALWGTLSSLLKNPLVLAILAGFTCSLLRLEMPAPVGRAIGMFSAASGVVALFVIGGTLVGLRPAGDLPRIAWVCAGKLVLHPLAVALAFLVFTPADPVLRAAGIVAASVPMFSVFPIVAQRYGEQAWCASALLVATVASFATMSIAMWLVGSPV